MKNAFKKVKRVLCDQSGAYSILIVILILILMTAMTAYMDIMNKKWTVGEVQAIMDTAGLNTLQNQVNNKTLRAEILTLDKDISNLSNSDYANRETTTFTPARQQKYKTDMALYYKKEIENQIKGRTHVTDYDVERVDINFSYDNFGLGDSKKQKLPQVTLDAVVRLRVAQSGMFDNVTSVQRTMYSARNEKDFTITYDGQTDDGQTELIVRSVTRLVYK